ncbi:MAG: hypothetical protein IT449_00375 [Phycisphaerales bacterium]|nr:hypothetical protein [Phycisphaerales bacterium]
MSTVPFEFTVGNDGNLTLGVRLGEQEARLPVRATIERLLTQPASNGSRHGIEPNKPLRILETRSGVLTIPLADEPMAEDLAREIEEWQALSTNAWDSFPFEGNGS